MSWKALILIFIIIIIIIVFLVFLAEWRGEACFEP